MNRQETKMILEILKAVYPNEFKNKDSEDMAQMLNVWSNWLQEDDADLFAKAIKQIATTDETPFMPNMAKIRNKVYEMTHPNEMSEQEAWNLVYKAICNSGYNSKEEWDKLPSILKQLVTPELLREYSQMDTDQVNTVVSSNIMRSYRVRSQKQKEYDMLPNDLKQIGAELKKIT